MSSNISINKDIENYINNHSLKLNKIQKEIILYNESLGQIKRMQIAISQCHFLHLIIKISKIKKILEIGTFTGLSTLSMSLALPADGQIVVALIDNNEAMLKRIRKKGNSVALESANKNYETKIFGPDRVKVQGVLVSLYRNF